MANERLKILQMLQEGTITVNEASTLLEAVEDASPPQRAESDAAPREADTAHTNGSAESPRSVGHPIAAATSEQASPQPIPPDMERFRRFIYLPFAVTLSVLILSGWGTYALHRQAEGRITPGFVTMVVLLVLATLATALTFWMTTVPWLHVRIQSAPGGTSAAKRADAQASLGAHTNGSADGSSVSASPRNVRRPIAISLPLPLTLAGWGLRLAHRFVDKETVPHLDTASALIQTMKGSLGKPGTEPIVVDVRADSGVNDEDERVQVYIG